MPITNSRIIPTAAPARPRRSPGPRALASIVALVAAACAVHTAAAPTAWPVVRPTDHGLTTAQLPDTSATFRFEFHSATGDSLLRVVPLRRAERSTVLAGEPGLLLTFAFGSPVTMSDTLAVRRRDLRPVWEVMRAGTRRVQLRYQDSVVHEVTMVADSAPRTATHALDGVPFSSNELEAIVRALPLRAGYHALLALYSPLDGKVERDTLQVLGAGAAADAAGARVWRVRFADRMIVQTFEIDQRTRAIRSQEILQRRTGRHIYYVPDSTHTPA